MSSPTAPGNAPPPADLQEASERFIAKLDADIAAGRRPAIPSHEECAVANSILFGLLEKRANSDDGYWTVPDGNHRLLLARIAIESLRELPLDRRMEVMGMEPVGLAHQDCAMSCVHYGEADADA